jgi:hypothetical protein
VPEPKKTGDLTVLREPAARGAQAYCWGATGNLTSWEGCIGHCSDLCRKRAEEKASSPPSRQVRQPNRLKMSKSGTLEARTMSLATFSQAASSESCGISATYPTLLLSQTYTTAWGVEVRGGSHQGKAGRLDECGNLYEFCAKASGNRHTFPSSGRVFLDCAHCRAYPKMVDEVLVAPTLSLSLCRQLGGTAGALRNNTCWFCRVKKTKVLSSTMTLPS